MQGLHERVNGNSMGNTKMQPKGKVDALLHQTKVTICIGFVGIDKKYVTSLQEQQQPQHCCSLMSLLRLLHSKGMITQV
jgi:hypothetical protein